MKIEAQSLTVIRQTLSNVRALLSVMHTENAGTPERQRTIRVRLQDLSDAMKMIDDSLGTMPWRTIRQLSEQQREQNEAATSGASSVPTIPVKEEHSNG